MVAGPDKPRRWKYVCLHVMILGVTLCFFLVGSIAAQYTPRTKTPVTKEASLTITEPSGGTVWEKGQRYTIKWTSANVRGGVKINLVNEKGKSYTVTGYATNSGSYNYTVSSSLPDGAYTLEITTSDGAVTARSSGTLTIQARTAVTKPEATSTYTPRVPTTTTTTPTVPSTATTTTTLPDRTEEMPVIQTEEREIEAPVRDDVSGFVYPDFEATDIAWVEEQQVLVIKVKNNGIAYDGMLEVHVVALEVGQAFTFDRTFNWDVSFQPVESQTFSVSGFSWPDPLNYPQLRIGCNIDPNNQITELNETNNGYDERVYIPCGIRIDTAYCTGDAQCEDPLMPQFARSHTWVMEDGRLALEGRFGEQGEKVIIMEKGSTVLRPMINLVWKDDYINISIPHRQETGTYNLTIYCTDPDNGYSYASDTIEVEVVSRDRIGFDPHDMAETMADGYEDWFVDPCSKIDIITQRTTELDKGGVLVESRFVCQCPEWIFHEVLQNGKVVKFGQNEGAKQEEEQVSSHTFPLLPPGKYVYRCRVTDTDGDADTASVSFEH